MRSLRALPPLLTLLAACNLDAPVQYRVPDLRILAIRAQVLPSPPSAAADVAPGAQVRLDALVANPRLRAGVTVDWFACLPPPLALLPPCSDPEWLQSPDAFDTATAADGVIRIGSTESVTLDTATLEPLLSSAVLATLDLAIAVPALRCSLATAVPVVAIARAEGVTEVAVKQVRLDPTASLSLPAYATLPDVYRLNLNPRVEAVQADPTDLSGCSGGAAAATPCAGPTDCAGGACATDGFCELALAPGEVTLCARATAESIQEVEQCQPDGGALTIQEELAWQWYVSAGEIAGTDFDGNATGGDVKLTPASGPFRLWLIVRDGRGGTDWLVRDLVGP